MILRETGSASLSAASISVAFQWASSMTDPLGNKRWNSTHMEVPLCRYRTSWYHNPRFCVSRSSACLSCRSKTGSASSISPPTDCRISLPPDHRILTAAATATMGSNGSQPVHITIKSPRITAKLVQESVKTCFPFATSTSERLRLPCRTRYHPKKAFTTAAAAVTSVPVSRF